MIGDGDGITKLNVTWLSLYLAGGGTDYWGPTWYRRTSSLGGGQHWLSQCIAIPPDRLAGRFQIQAVPQVAASEDRRPSVVGRQGELTAMSTNRRSPKP